MNGPNTIDAATSEANRAMILGLVIGLIVVLLISGIALFVAALISNDLRFVSESLKEMSTGEGDLTKRLSTKSNDEIGGAG
ncbi:hypothetical protein MNBD_GAMMA23-1724 [hydrothermal vent metagenome]|uniref:Uncharacterized protein n=1 Tax=hydrothermal vent metagenome TaxID=652676 RepID=A0A3B1AU51_9ZZZZ